MTRTAMIPYADIIEAADRRWTARLLERLASPDVPGSELEDLVGALQAMSDPRSVSPLEATLTDLGRPARIREAAGSILGGMQYLTPDVPAEKLRRWWAEGDTILRRHALSCMDRVDCPDIVLRVAADTSHEFHAEAIGRMLFFFDRPEDQKIKLAALSHPDAGVREAVATVLLWDEPVAAEVPLLTATRDPVPEVAAEAANTLEYYPSLRVIHCLHELLGHADKKVREEARDSYQAICCELLYHLRDQDPHVSGQVRRWLRPAWDLLAFTAEELQPGEDEGTATRPEKPDERMPVADLLAMLADPGTSPRLLNDRLWSDCWRAYGEYDRRRLRPVFLMHPDPLVRERAAWIFAAWEDAGGLLTLIRDPDLGVRKVTMYNLGQLPPMAGMASLAWDYLHQPGVLGCHATETLDTFVKHTDRPDAVRRLGWIASDHGRREELRVAAVHHLARLGATDEVGQLAGLLLEPPEVTWALHLALLEAITDLGLPRPDLGHLREVDNLHVQAAVARIME